MNKLENYFRCRGRRYEMSNERNQITVEKIIMLMGEIAVLESRFKDHDTGNLRTAVSVLKKRVVELTGKIRG